MPVFLAIVLVTGEVGELPHLGNRRDRARVHGDDDAEHVRHRLDLKQVVAESLDLEHALLLSSCSRREVLELVAAKQDMRDASRLYVDQQRGQVAGAVPGPASRLDRVDVTPESVLISGAKQGEEFGDRRSDRPPAYVELDLFYGTPNLVGIRCPEPVGDS